MNRKIRHQYRCLKCSFLFSSIFDMVVLFSVFTIPHPSFECMNGTGTYEVSHKYQPMLADFHAVWFPVGCATTASLLKYWSAVVPIQVMRFKVAEPRHHSNDRWVQTHPPPLPSPSPLLTTAPMLPFQTLSFIPSPSPSRNTTTPSFHYSLPLTSPPPPSPLPSPFSFPFSLAPP